jgi:small subunit ribosomal protein S13
MNSLKNLNTFTTINSNKNIFTSLKKIHGLNFYSIKNLKALNGWFLFGKSKNLSVNNFFILKDQVEFFYNLENNKIFNNINKKKKIKNYSGMRHILKLPARGQRTHTNSKTPRKNIKTEI